MIKDFIFTNTYDADTWFEVAKIPLQNPPYQTDYAPTITNTTIDYIYIQNSTIYKASQNLTYNGTTVLHSCSYDTLTFPFTYSTETFFGYYLGDDHIKILLKIPLNAAVTINSNSQGIYQSTPTPFDGTVSNQPRVGSRFFLNFGASANFALYGATSITNVASNELSAFTDVSSYFGLFFKGTYGSPNSMSVIPFYVYNGSVVFSDADVSATLDGNIVTFTTESARPMAVVSFV